MDSKNPKISKNITTPQKKITKKLNNFVSFNSTLKIFNKKGVVEKGELFLFRCSLIDEGNKQ